MCVCVRGRKGKKESVCICVCERVRVCVCLCVYVYQKPKTPTLWRNFYIFNSRMNHSQAFNLKIGKNFEQVETFNGSRTEWRLTFIGWRKNICSRNWFKLKIRRLEYSIKTKSATYPFNKLRKKGQVIGQKFGPGYQAMILYSTTRRYQSTVSIAILISHKILSQASTIIVSLSIKKSPLSNSTFYIHQAYTRKLTFNG